MGEEYESNILSRACTFYVALKLYFYIATLILHALDIIPEKPQRVTIILIKDVFQCSHTYCAATCFMKLKNIFLSMRTGNMHMLNALLCVSL